MNLSEKIMDLVLWYADAVLMLERRYIDFAAEASGLTGTGLAALDKAYDEECGNLLNELTDQVNEIVKEEEKRQCGEKCCECYWDDLK